VRCKGTLFPCRCISDRRPWIYPIGAVARAAAVTVDTIPLYHRLDCSPEREGRSEGIADTAIAVDKVDSSKARAGSWL
jgi:hypothetical protein